MRSKLFFWILVVIVFGGLAVAGFVFFEKSSGSLWIIEAIAIGTFILFVMLYRRLLRPYRIIMEGIELIKEQDFSSRLRYVQSSEANKVIDVFNRMIIQLKNERLSVREKNRFLDLLIKHSPQGVVMLDFNERITYINPAGMRFLRIDDLSVVAGKKLIETELELNSHLATLKYGDDAIIRTSGIKAFRCIRSSFPDSGFNHPFILVEELTEELHRAEKESYEKLIRLMSHEVNNSMGSVSGVLDVVLDVLEQEKDIRWKEIISAVDASAERCRHLVRFTGNLAEVVKLPDPSYSKVSLNELVRTVDALLRIECRKRNITLRLELSSMEPVVWVDGIQIEQVLVNIVKNAYEAIGTKGEIVISTDTEPLSVVVTDNGPGFTDEVKQNLFSPFFTTKPSGQGVGLTFVREVLLKHKSDFKLYSDNGLTRFEVIFPDQSPLSE